MDIIQGFPPTSQNTAQLNVVNILKHAARNFARQEIVNRKPNGSMHRYTYKDAFARTQRLADALISLGLRAGDRVGVLSWNTHRNYEIYFGLPGIGAVMLLLNLRLSPDELSYVVTHAGARMILVDADLLPIAETIAPLCKTVEGYVILTDKKEDEFKTPLNVLATYEHMLQQAKPEFDWPMIDENSASSACYTTGTTGKPKGVYHSQRDVFLQAMMYVANARISVEDCVLQLVPMFHVLGWGTPYAATLAGSKLVFPGKYSLEDIDGMAEIILQEGVTFSGGVPSLLMPMLEQFISMEPQPDLSHLRFICGGSEPPLALMKGFMDATGAEIIHSYGSTEAQAIVTINRITPWLYEELSESERWTLKKKQGSVVAGLDVKIVGEEGSELPHDGESVGEILLRGPWVTGSYHNAPETGSQFTEDGFLKTGDMGALDSEGFLKITDRLKDLIKSGGEWISSVDMENEIVGHPAVLEAAVVGVPHPKWQERPIALVVLHDDLDSSIEGKDIEEHLSKRFAKWQVPEKILFVDTIPMTSVGKIDKKVIRAEFREVYKDKV
jgi:fatty-acyl-CoA synthase